MLTAETPSLPTPFYTISGRYKLKPSTGYVERPGEPHSFHRGGAISLPEMYLSPVLHRGPAPITLIIPCFSDVDECSSNNGGCEHVCQNQLGSFQCDCEFGYKLDEDRRSCSGKCSLCPYPAPPARAPQPPTPLSPAFSQHLLPLVVEMTHNTSRKLFPDRATLHSAFQRI